MVLIIYFFNSVYNINNDIKIKGVLVFKCYRFKVYVIYREFLDCGWFENWFCWFVLMLVL